METKFVYMTADQIEERKAKIAAIEGLAEIRASLADDKKTVGEIDELRAKYPRASAYLEAEQWIYSGNPVKVRLAARALEKIMDGVDPAAVLDEMSNGLDAFNMAQGG